MQHSSSGAGSGNVPVAGSVTVSNFPAIQPVSGPLTDAQLRASDVSVSVTGVATASNQTSTNTKLDTLHADLVTVEGKQDTGNTSLSSIDTKLTSQATASNQTSTNTKLDTLHTDLGLLATASAQTSSNTKLDTLHTDIGSSNTKLDTLHTDLGLLATASAQTSSNTKLDTLHTDIGSSNTKLDTLHTDLGLLATASAQTSSNTKLDTLHTDLGLLATASAQTSGNASLSSIDSKLTNPLPVSFSSAALSASSAIIGKVGIDQTTPGTTNGVVATSAAGDTNSELLEMMLFELRAMRSALTALACDGNKYQPEDFDPNYTRFDTKNLN